MLLMNKNCSSSTWSGVEILIVAPYSKVDIPIVEFQINIASSVRAVPANEYTFRMSVFRDSWNIEILSRIELYAR